MDSHDHIDNPWKEKTNPNNPTNWWLQRKIFLNLVFNIIVIFLFSFVHHRGERVVCDHLQGFQEWFHIILSRRNQRIQRRPSPHPPLLPPTRLLQRPLHPIRSPPPSTASSEARHPVQGAVRRGTVPELAVRPPRRAVVRVSQPEGQGLCHADARR